MSRAYDEVHTEAVDECCGPQTPNGYEREFDARFAGRLAREYRQDGLTPAARHIVDIAQSNGLEGASVLEIGGGSQTILAVLARQFPGESSVELPLVAVRRLRSAAVLHCFSMIRCVRGSTASGGRATGLTSS